MIEIIGAVGKVDVDNALNAVEGISKKSNIEVALFDGELIFGERHLISAYEHAKRAFEMGDNTAKTIAMETMLYASGERQISRAIEKMGIKQGGNKVALAIIGDSAKEHVSELLSALNMERDDDVLLPDEKNLVAFGITKKEQNAVPKEKRHELVLERVALVDLIK
jgi:KEOPS complex subunit Cgi121